MKKISVASAEELAASLESHERRLTDAQARFNSLKPSHPDDYQSPETRQAHRAARIEVEDLTAAIGRINAEIATARALSVQAAAVATAPGEAAAAAQARRAHQATIAHLCEQIAMVKQRIEGIRQESASALGRLGEREEEAHHAFAVAVSHGDERTIEAAQATLNDIHESRAEAQQLANRNNGLIAALEAQAAQLNVRLADATSAEQRSRVAHAAAIEVALVTEWNSAVDALAALGAKVAAIRAAQGGVFNLLDSVAVPRLGMHRGQVLRISTIRDMAALVDVEKLMD